MHTVLCVCPPRVEFLFPSVLLKSCNQIPLAFKVWFSGNSSCCHTPGLGSLTWGSGPSLQSVDFCGIIVLQFWVTHLAVMGFDFIVIVPLLPCHCTFFFVFGCGVSFLVSSSVLSMIVELLWFRCSCKREWAHVLLLCHLEPISKFSFIWKKSSRQFSVVLWDQIF